MSRLRRAVAPLVMLVGLSALPARGEDAAGAELLMKQGQQLLKDGKLEDACSNFAKALSLHQHPRIQLNLADCHEKQGKLASAWRGYVEARRMSKNMAEQSPREQERQAYAEEKIKVIEPRLSFLLVEVPVKAPGLKVSRGDQELPDALLGTKIPVDTGKHAMSARAPGYKPWSAEVSVSGEGTTTSVKIPALEVDPSAPAASSAAAPPTAPTATTSSAAGHAGGGGNATLGYVLAGVGLAATGVGAFFGFKALSTYKEADEQCPTHKACAFDVKSTRDRASSQATLANVGLGLGVVGLGVGAYFILTAPKSGAERGLRFSPTVGSGSAGAILAGSF